MYKSPKIQLADINISYYMPLAYTFSSLERKKKLFSPFFFYIYLYPMDYSHLCEQTL